ncbi:E3 ubiquitin ligase family protein [Actinomadura madurae]|uniref:E3 ubiquitin ligase family protein n=1 Tax=Actinomadura madurae TaxID=1993 RepID=UPI0020270C0E|nr:E3 ubiquitin ligase family protein [Actinomadura madurae]MCP9950727.1 E3 ubiquitin ligase family protein [Actinomadura madurae]MCP9967504.1 E3 ubiquitin ligase family protein [Actinomadura madurae]MCP9979956.1 E3 ubiquitin ligase family protein [Actinomadura madurae]MCQ0008511.1 E3 ubiquitin ligase family protein [Actinomadura madurae]MCQ0016171.1 E3 ubiquitin ligase family protein [Actinomadura madurae]
MSDLSPAIVFLLILAAVLLAAGWVWRLRFRSLRRAVATSCAGVAGLPGGVPCQVSGTAQAVQPAPFSGTPCAWYRVRATAKTRSGKRVFMDEKSAAPFPLQDESGRFTVDPGTAAVDGAVRTMDERRPEHGSLPGLTTEEVSEYRYEEWILPAGRPLYILGTATGGSIGKDEKTGQYSITTRTRREFGRRAVMFMGIGYGGGACLVLASAVIVALDHLD